MPYIQSSGDPGKPSILRGFCREASALVEYAYYDFGTERINVVIGDFVLQAPPLSPSYRRQPVSTFFVVPGLVPGIQ